MGAAVPVVSSGPEAVGDGVHRRAPPRGQALSKHNHAVCRWKVAISLVLQISKECEGAKGGRVFDF